MQQQAREREDEKLESLEENNLSTPPLEKKKKNGKMEEEMSSQKVEGKKPSFPLSRETDFLSSSSLSSFQKILDLFASSSCFLSTRNNK
jgi:hypothetical protein